MSATGYYDPDLEMFCEDASPHGADCNRMLFLRWLIEHRRMNTRRADDETESGGIDVSLP